MKARKLTTIQGQKNEVWIAADGEDIIHIWLDEDGLKTRRISGDNLVHGIQTLPFGQVVAKAEGQLLLKFP